MPLLLGITRSRRNLRPNAVFYLRTLLSSAEVSVCYSRFHNAESDELLAVRDKDALPSNNLAMPSCSRGALYLFSQWLQRKTLRSNQVGTGQGFSEALYLAGETAAAAASALGPHQASSSYMWVGGGGGPEKEAVSFGGLMGAPGPSFHQGSGHQGGPSFHQGSEAWEAPQGSHVLAWREVGGGGGAWRGMDRSRSESTGLDKLRSQSAETRLEQQEDNPPLGEAKAVDGHGQPAAAHGPTMRRIQSDASIRLHRDSRDKEVQKEEDSKLIRAVYWWMSTSQDPDNIRKALVDMELEEEEEKNLTDEQLVAVMQRRLEILEESSTSSDSSSSEEDEETPRQRERRLQKVSFISFLFGRTSHRGGHGP